MVIIDFCLAVLAAYGLDHYLLHKPKITPQIFIFIVLFGVLGFFAWKNSWVISLKNLVFPIGILISGLIVLKIPRFTVIALLVLTLVDLSRFFIKFESFSDSVYLFPDTKVTKFLQDQGKTDVFRVAALDDRIFPPNFATHYKIQMISGYDSLYLKNYANLIGGVSRIVSPKNPVLFDNLNVKYILTFDTLTVWNYKLVLEEGQTKVYENITALPRVSLPGGSAKITKYLPDEVVVMIQSQTGGQLVLRDIYYPDWWVTLDGQKQPIFQVDNLFRGVSVPAGNHEVIFKI